MAINLQRYSFGLVILLNIIIIAIKACVYKYTDSIAVFSSLTDSVLDLAISTINSFVFIYAIKPKDDDHKFGHSAIEDLVALLQIILIFASSVFMFYKALTVKTNYQFSWNYLFLMLANVVPLLLIIVVQIVAGKGQSTIIKTDLLHYSTDLFTLCGVIVSMVLTYLTSIIWCDVFVGALVIFVIAYSCFGGVVQAFHNLMAREIDDAEINKIIQTIQSTEGIVNYKNLRTRRAGHIYFLNVDIIFPNDISLQNAHVLAHKLEDEIHKIFPNCDIIIHMEPLNS